MYINECIRNEKYDAIIPYLESSMDELNSSYSKINTGNLVIDSFVSNYLLFAEDNNIDFQPDLQIDATIIPINDYDLSIVIGNLLDNAINACNEISDNNRKYIRLYIRTDLESDQFVIHIINSKTQKTAPTNDNRIIHGYGLINIQEHIEKLFGIMNSKETENEFETTVIIPLTPPKQSERNTK
jgi:sensor histidine kinase regulating citrate/malate metabolism